MTKQKSLKEILTEGEKISLFTSIRLAPNELLTKDYINELEVLLNKCIKTTSDKKVVEFIKNYEKGELS